MSVQMRVVILVAVVAAGCAGAPRTAPIKGGPVTTGPGTIEAARKFLEGRWTLTSFEVFPVGGKGVQLKGKGNGTLSYDAFGNLDMQIRVEDKNTSEELARAGIPITNGVISSTGRAAIDLTARTLTYFLEGQKPLVPTGPAGPLALSRPRHWVVEGNILTTTTRYDDGQPASVARWEKLP
jgi:hypothetical protein